MESLRRNKEKNGLTNCYLWNRYSLCLARKTFEIRLSIALNRQCPSSLQESFAVLAYVSQNPRFYKHLKMHLIQKLFTFSLCLSVRVLG